MLTQPLPPNITTLIGEPAQPGAAPQDPPMVLFVGPAPVTGSPTQPSGPAQPSGRPALPGEVLALPEYRIGGQWQRDTYTAIYPAGIVPVGDAPLTAAGGIITLQAKTLLTAGPYAGQWEVTFAAQIIGGEKMTVTDVATGITGDLFNTFGYPYGLNSETAYPYYGFRVVPASPGGVAVLPGVLAVKTGNLDNVVKTYEIRDFAGAVVDTGPVGTGQYFDLTFPLVTRPGAYTLDLFNAAGVVVATTRLSLTPADNLDNNLPGLVNAANYGTNSDPANANLDVNTLCYVSYGPARLSVNDPANYDLEGLKAAAAALVRGYINGKDGAATDPVNPRQLIINFPNFDTTQPGHVAGVTAAVAAMYPLGVRNFAGRNEPGWAGDAGSLLQVRAFRDAVHAGHPDAQAVGIEAVNAAGAGTEATLAAARDLIDAYGFHFYDRKTVTLDAMRAMLTRTGYQDKPLWMTEGGFEMSAYGVGIPYMAASGWCEQAMLFPKYGIPPERVPYWYPKHSFFDHATWYLNADGSYNPQALWSRRSAVELWGKKFASIYNFGQGGSSLWDGNRFVGQGAREGETTGVFYGRGGYRGVLKLAVAGPNVPAVLTARDGWGNETVLPVIGGAVSLPLMDGLLHYLTYPSTLTVTPQTDRGANLALGKAVTTDSHQDRAAMLTDGTGAGVFGSDSNWFASGAGQNAFLAGDTAFPYTVDVDLGTAQAVGSVVLRSQNIIQSLCGVISADIYTSVDGVQFVKRGEIRQPASTLERFTNEGTLATNCTDYFPGQVVWSVDMGGASARHIRIVVTEATPGGAGDMLSAGYGGFPSFSVDQRHTPRQVNLSQIEVYA